jgi:hypothetical protein
MLPAVFVADLGSLGGSFDFTSSTRPLLSLHGVVRSTPSSTALTCHKGCVGLWNGNTDTHSRLSMIDHRWTERMPAARYWPISDPDTIMSSPLRNSPAKVRVHACVPDVCMEVEVAVT